MNVARADAQSQPAESPVAFVAPGSLAAAAPLDERASQASLLGSLDDLAPTKPGYVPKQPNDMRRVGLDALEAEDAA